VGRSPETWDAFQPAAPGVAGPPAFGIWTLKIYHQRVAPPYLVVLLQLGSPLATLAALDFWLALWICSFLTSLGKRGEIPQMHQAAAAAAAVVVAAIKTAAAAAATTTTTTTTTSLCTMGNYSRRGGYPWPVSDSGLLLKGELSRASQVPMPLAMSGLELPLPPKKIRRHHHHHRRW